MKRIILTLTLALFTLPILNAQDLPSYVPTEGLVAYYPFNGNANDASGNGYHGTRFQVGDGLDRNGNQNQSLYFNGKTADGTNNQQIINDSYVKVDNFDYSFSTSSLENQISISFWVKNEWNNQISPNDGLPILSRRTNNNIDFDLSLSGSNYNPSNAPALHLGFWSESSAQSIPDNSWTHFVVTCDGSNVKYYMQNQLYAEFSHDNGVISNNTSNLMIGKYSYQGALLHHFFFNGWIDDLGIWNKALTVEEISDLYNGSTTDGEILLNGKISAENNQIKNVADPTDAQDAVTMAYLQTKLDKLSNRVKYLEDNVDVDCGVSYFEDFNSCDLTDYYAQGGNITSTSDGYEGCGVYMTHYAGQDSNNFYAIDKKFLYGVYELDAIADNGISDNIVRVLQQETLAGGYTFSFRPTNTDNPGWSVFINGELIDSADAFPVARGSWYNIKIEVLKNSLKIWINDVVLFETDSITPPSDVPGYFKVGVAYSGAFDNLKFTPDSSSCK
ncbi:MAG: Uncharacterised protein [Formosa sp. Hel3_A1_48]|nr:MAG: Uncharacterised protein [Formosa sp. Hel3_A1_48]